MLFPLVSFFIAVEADARIGVSHISLYLALLSQADESSPSKGFNIRRDMIIRKARISSRTYFKCIRELAEYGYLEYIPSPNGYYDSRVQLNLKDFSNRNGKY
jgi:hypothetical protein